MKLKKDSSVQKLRGAYYTPLQLANEMVQLFRNDAKIATILEPSCGDGVFIDSAIETGLLNTNKDIIAIEIEGEEVKLLQKRFSNCPNIEIIQQDFFDFYQKTYKNKKFDLIIGNPPYIRYQYLTEKQRKTLSDILESHGMKANKLINAWVGFLVACIQLLAENGKIAFVVPAEILQVAYAEDLRLFLSNNLSKITLITFEKLIFPDIEQEVIVFIGEKDKEEKGIRIIEMKDLYDFKSLDLKSNGYQKMQHVHEKWTKYFTTGEEIKLIQQFKKDSRFQKFSDCGLINVGITTGNNKFFSVDHVVAEKYKLNNVLLPLIGRSSHAHGIYFTEKDWKQNVRVEKRAQLINFQNIPYEDYPEEHKEYIQLGEKTGENKGYKCAIRDRWYIIPSIWTADAFFLRRNNLYPKFVLNRCNAVSTDTMHRIKFNDGVDQETILLSYYNSISFAFTEICGRSYGGGVLEILPGEVGNIILPKISDIKSELKRSLLDRIDKIIRDNTDIEEALDLVDQEILVNVLNIDTEVCNNFRAIWLKLQGRRLKRG